MYHVTRSEFDINWELEKSGDQQNTQDISGTKFGLQGQPTEQVTMNRMQHINTPRIEVTQVEDRKNKGYDAGRSEETDREAMKQEILGPILDVDFSGDPLAANEESVSQFEPERAATDADAEAAEARLDELSGAETEEAPEEAAAETTEGGPTEDSTPKAPRTKKSTKG